MQIETGLYRHYKGNLYEVLMTARHSESEEWMVVYRAPYDNDSLWVRPYEMFVQEVEVDGKMIARFEKLEGEC
jgi:hypothetical protein